MKEAYLMPRLFSWLLGLAVFVIGASNLIFVHPVPGVVFLLLSLLYLPQVDTFLQRRLGFGIPLAVKIVLGIAVIWFTLGVSDLGDMID
ncbi:hypothetical protein [Pontibacter litorisediminis]|uniref:hypothetical protein n=1 Tax=Pontibacter litorisediminis TaxID=1846260 RepID=UPI0023EA93BF|nr:hypothetical protein [Pontibacter litorisediminis]